MKIPRDIVEKRMAEFLEACQRKCLKLTHQRLEIYRELAVSEEHPAAETIHRRVRRRLPTISQDTVYRNLKLLAQEGLISIVGMSHERLRFDANMGMHHHFVCVHCGLIRDFYSSNSAVATMPKEAKTFGEPVSLRLEVKGVCHGCRTRRRGKR
ncbi:MAG: transcriptional repressor [bacterium]|nr:transcriptional repressor [bacterium]